MKKNTLRKLVLNRETLVELDRGDIRQAAGGATYFCSEVSCVATCASCSPTCTSRLC
jgi:hypothetical protein